MGDRGSVLQAAVLTGIGLFASWEIGTRLAAGTTIIWLVLLTGLIVGELDFRRTAGTELRRRLLEARTLTERYRVNRRPAWVLGGGMALGSIAACLLAATLDGDWFEFAYLLITAVLGWVVAYMAASFGYGLAMTRARGREQPR